jgi:nitrate reductase NapE component
LALKIITPFFNQEKSHNKPTFPPYFTTKKKKLEKPRSAIFHRNINLINSYTTLKKLKMARHRKRSKLLTFVMVVVSIPLVLSVSFSLTFAVLFIRSVVLEHLMNLFLLIISIFFCYSKSLSLLGWAHSGLASVLLRLHPFLGLGPLVVDPIKQNPTKTHRQKNHLKKRGRSKNVKQATEGIQEVDDIPRH